MSMGQAEVEDVRVEVLVHSEAPVEKDVWGLWGRLMMDRWLAVQVGKVWEAACMGEVWWKAKEKWRREKGLEVEVEGWGRRMMVMSTCHGGLEGGWTVVEAEEMVGRWRMSRERGQI